MTRSQGVYTDWPDYTLVWGNKTVNSLANAGLVFGIDPLDGEEWVN